MAHTFDTNLRFSGSYSPLTSDYTCGSGATVLVLGIVETTARNGGSPTYNGEAFTLAGLMERNGGTRIELWYFLAPPVGSAYEINVPNTSSVNLYIQASSYCAGFSYKSVLDVYGSSYTFSSNPTVSVTTTVNGDVIVGVLIDWLDTAPTAQTGTNLNRTDNGSLSDSNQYELQSTAGVYVTGWTCAYSDWAMCVAAFKEETITVHVTVEPTVLALSLSLPNSSIDISGSPTVVLSALALTASLQSPIITGDVTCSPIVLALTLAIKTATPVGTAVVSPAVQALTSTVNTPSIAISKNLTIIPPALHLVISVKSPILFVPLAAKVRMIPFIYSSWITYMMEFGDYYARFYYNSAPLLDGTGTHVEITTPYSEDDLFELQARQLADVMRITHPDYLPYILSRTSATEFSLAEIAFEKGPFLTRNDLSNDDGITMICNVTDVGDTGHLTASDSIFQAGHVGALFQLTHPRINLKTEGTKTGTQTGVLGEAIEVLGDYTFDITSSDWHGTVKLQKSANDWVTVTDVVSYTSKDSYSGTEAVAGTLYRINVTSHIHDTISASLTVNSSLVSGSMSGDDTGVIKTPLQIKGDFTFVTHGNWDGTVVLERNENNGGWESYQSYVSKIVSGAGDYNVRLTDTEELDNVQYRINMIIHSSGTIYVDLSATQSTQKGIVRIDGVSTSTSAWVTVLSEIGSSTETTRWSEGAWSDVRGYPTSMCFFEDRADYAGKTGSLPYFWFSKSGDYDNFEEGLEDDDSFAVAIPTTNQIAWIEALNNLIFATEGGNGELGMISSNKLDYAITPTNFSVRMQSACGSANIQPVKIKDVILFVDYTRRKVMEVVWRDADQTYVTPELTELAEHITLGGITSIAHQRSPESILWCTIEGAMHVISMTYDREQEEVAWVKHPTQGIVQSIERIPGYSGDNEDELWISVVRTIGSTSKIYIEQFAPWYFDAKIADAFFVDSGVAYAGVYTNTISGLSHLEGNIVSILADGVVYANQTVSGGTVILPGSVRKAMVGLPFTSVAILMPLDVNTPLDTTHGAIKKIHRIVVSFLNTLGAKYGNSEDNLYDIVWPIEGALYTGDLALTFDGGFSRDDVIVISQSDPLPCTIRAIVPHFSITG